MTSRHIPVCNFWVAVAEGAEGARGSGSVEGGGGLGEGLEGGGGGVDCLRGDGVGSVGVGEGGYEV